MMSGCVSGPAGAACCRRHPRSCTAVRREHTCAQRDASDASTATVAVASPDVVSLNQWRDFDCRFGALSTVYVGSSHNPCRACSYTFVALAAHDSHESWGRHIVAGLRRVWDFITHHHGRRHYLWYMFARVDMRWLVEPRVLLRHIRTGTPPERPAVYVPDTESYWGVNDRFGVCNAAAASAYFGERASLLASHTGNTESLLAAALKASGALVLLTPTLGTLACCASRARAECHSKVCRRVWLNHTTAAEATTSRSRASRAGVVVSAKYIFEAQAAVQNAEGLLRRTAMLGPCAAGTMSCVRPTNPASPHACLPMAAVCVKPPPAIAWRALWRRNSSEWFRWIDPPPWRTARGVD